MRADPQSAEPVAWAKANLAANLDRHAADTVYRTKAPAFAITEPLYPESALIAERQAREAAERDGEEFRSKLAETIGKLFVAEASLAKAEARIAELEAALKPFAEAASGLDKMSERAGVLFRGDYEPQRGWITLAHLRRARSALSSINKEPSNG